MRTAAHNPQPNVTIPSSIIDSSTPSSADELCDELMLHTFDCDDCINGREETCTTFCALRDQIDEAGGPTRGTILSM